MKVAIYHMTTTGFLAGLDRVGRMPAAEAAGVVAEAALAGHYVYCARLKFDEPMAEGSVDFDRAMEIAWRLTNNVEESWAQGEKVIYARSDTEQRSRSDTEQRSSMVGDIFVYGPDCWVVASAGFIKLPSFVTEILVENSREGTAFDDAETARRPVVS